LFFLVLDSTNITVNVNVPDTQQVGQSLILECNVTAVRNTTSRIDIVWSSNSSELKRIEGANASYITNDSEVYIVFYDILQLSTSDEGRVFQCDVLVNASALVMATSNVTLDVNGKS